MRTLLSLCDHSGSWSAPYAEAGWRVVMVDSKHPEGWTDRPKPLFGGLVTTYGGNILDDEFQRFVRDSGWDAILAAPPCTTFCRPGARWWAKMDASGQTEQDVRTMRACLEICKRAKLFWALENPPGRHQRLIPELGKPSWQYHPWEYGDPWGKQTYIWGTAAKPPVVSPVKPEPTRQTPNGRWQGRIAFMSSSWKAEREKTPAGFAKAFYETNSLPTSQP